MVALEKMQICIFLATPPPAVGGHGTGIGGG